jgi:hypothetical protein
VKDALRQTLLQNCAQDQNIDAWYRIITSSDIELPNICLGRIGMHGIQDPAMLDAMMDKVSEEIRTFYAIMSQESKEF